MSQVKSARVHRSTRFAGALLGLLLAFTATLPAAHAKACKPILECTVDQDITICHYRCL